MKRHLLSLIFPALFTAGLPAAFAVMKPETSMLLIQEADGGGSINVTNTDDKDALLYVKVVDLPDDPRPKLDIAQPVMRVGAGKTQRVRFILNSDHALQHEHFKRVIFESIRPKTADTENSIAVNFRHNIPVVIHPRGLAANADPWKALVWKASSTTLSVHNPSPWVVRLAQNVTLLPGKAQATLTKSYVLPEQTLTLKVPTGTALSSVQQVRMETLSKYGYEAGQFTLPVSH